MKTMFLGICLIFVNDGAVSGFRMNFSGQPLCNINEQQLGRGVVSDSVGC